LLPPTDPETPVTSNAELAPPTDLAPKPIGLLEPFDFALPVEFLLLSGLAGSGGIGPLICSKGLELFLRPFPSAFRVTGAVDVLFPTLAVPVVNAGRGTKGLVGLLV